jgi:ribosomal protein L11 methylase PrmA
MQTSTKALGPSEACRLPSPPQQVRCVQDLGGLGEFRTYTARAMQHKGQIVSRFLDQTGSKVVWDLGANTGSFSRLASLRGSLVISADSDPACVEVNYLHCLEEGETNILPLLLDLTNPSPGLGWASEERMSMVERGPADTVLALALLHHLAFTNNLPFARIADFLSRICRWLIIEFVPKSDSQIQKLLRTREGIFPEYTQQAFETRFSEYFTLLDSVELEDSDRTLYFMEEKSGRVS